MTLVPAPSTTVIQLVSTAVQKPPDCMSTESLVSLWCLWSLCGVSGLSVVTLVSLW